jgi:hypothetical protein
LYGYITMHGQQNIENEKKYEKSYAYQMLRGYRWDFSYEFLDCND